MAMNVAIRGIGPEANAKLISGTPSTSIVHTDSPKNTMSGLTSPPHFGSLHFGMLTPPGASGFLVMTSFRISSPGNSAPQSIQWLSANEPWASTSWEAGTPARRSSVSMFYEILEDQSMNQRRNYIPA
jgi:hypothetical protein